MLTDPDFVGRTRDWWANAPISNPAPLCARSARDGPTLSPTFSPPGSAVNHFESRRAKMGEG